MPPSPSGAEAPATRPRRMLSSGASKAVSDAFLTLCDTYLGKDRSRTMQAAVEAAIKRYDDRDLTAKQLADFIAATYETIGDLQDVSHEAAWISSVESKKPGPSTSQQEPTTAPGPSTSQQEPSTTFGVYGAELEADKGKPRSCRRKVGFECLTPQAR